jgi:hypothetical protein
MPTWNNSGQAANISPQEGGHSAERLPSGIAERAGKAGQEAAPANRGCGEWRLLWYLWSGEGPMWEM